MKLDSDLWRYRFGLRFVAGLNALVGGGLVLKGDWPTAAVCGVVGLLNVVMALNIDSHQRTRNTIRELTAALRERSDLNGRRP